jgi:hypothetical protein
MADNTQNRLLDVVYLRCIAILSVVAWHSYCPYICWNIAETPMSNIYRTVFRFIAPDANMPLFTFIAGYLFCCLLKYKGKYQKFSDFAKSKVRRLLIPFLVLGTIINLTEPQKNIVDLFYGKPNHMWYCLMLFYCFIGCWFVEKKAGSRWNIGLMLTSFVAVAVFGGGALGPNTPLGIWLPVYYYGYFYVGFLVYDKRETLLIFFNKKSIMLLMIAFLTSAYLGWRLLIITTLSFLLLAWILVNKNQFAISKFIESNKMFLRFITKLDKYSFGIYVFHQWIIWELTRTECIIDKLQPVFIEHDVLSPMILFVCVVIVSFTFTHFSLKTKIGKSLLT